ncbi:hypothetical protein SLEP1_g58456 [Rubroshorea leprosula]|uniref:Malectin-like domain-containing protein n=1 Tax=Rubroshorea leprosula TaxID=152421 RepID=A0AAV5MTF1_9ROSI|nr:hypothetical protein SLEP1_g58456 [Rubroshorea leprosula]
MSGPFFIVLKYMHFAEVEEHIVNQNREFNISQNGELFCTAPLFQSTHAYTGTIYMSSIADEWRKH